MLSKGAIIALVDRNQYPDVAQGLSAETLKGLGNKSLPVPYRNAY